MNQFQQRREQFFNKMQDNSVAILPASQEQTRNNDCDYPFRQNSDFHYLTDFNEPEAMLVLVKKADEQLSILFNRKKDKTAEIWNGYRLGQEAAVSTLGMDQAYVIEEFDAQLEKLVNGAGTVYYPIFQSDALNESLKKVVNKLRAGKRKGAVVPNSYVDCLPMLHEMRLIKSDFEGELLSKAGEISAAGHIRAMKTCHVGMWEFQLEGEIKHEFALGGSSNVAYNSIVAGGNNACILHYNENDQQLKDGDLVLIDAGAEYQTYAGDITRTFPVNGKFTEHQAKLYQLVLDTQIFAISQVKPGASLFTISDQVVELLIDGLLSLGLLKGDRETLIKEEAHKAFYMHGLGHYLGLDVHDAGEYGTAENPRLLEAGMSITIEPGLYVSQDADCDDCWKGIGIRIEDDLLVTATGAKVMSAAAPKAIDEIEALMSDAKANS